MIINAVIPEVGWTSQYEALPCAACRHFVALHQTGHGTYTGWCSFDDGGIRGGCKCERPTIDTAEQIAVERGIPLARMQELASATRDEDGWPVGADGLPVKLTESEHWAIQEHDSLAQSAEEAEDFAVDHGVSYRGA